MKMTWSRLNYASHVIQSDKQTVLSKKMSCGVTDIDFIYLCQIRHHYNIKYSSLTTLFFNIIPKDIDAFI
jgi:hypothetical protein